MSAGKCPIHWLRNLAAIFGLFAVSRMELPAWTLQTIQDREYVPMSEVQTFYDFTFGTTTAEWIKFVKPNKILLAQIGTRELYLNNLRFHLSLPVLKEGGVTWLSRLDLSTTIDPVLRPSCICGGAVRTIVLDAGHGGNDQGTWSYYGSEKTYALDVAQRAAPLLRARGLNVVLTRRDDSYIPLDDRVAAANRNADALFISIHFNAGALTRGIETYALTPAGVPSTDNPPTLLDWVSWPGNAHDSENAALATAIHGCILPRVHSPDRGIRRARFHVLKGIHMPGVLIEGGYLAGQDAFAISHADYRQALAESIAAGIVRYIAAVPENAMELPLPPPPAATPAPTLAAQPPPAATPPAISPVSPPPARLPTPDKPTTLVQSEPHAAAQP
ncbi:MAG: N-acetylmuramoyl-L-alanine amidase [Chthoniobacterales bacterium]